MMRIERLEGIIIGFFGKRHGRGSPAAIFSYCILLSVLMAFIGYLSGSKFGMTALFLIPVSLAALRAGKVYGYMLSVISGGSMEILSLHTQKHFLFSIFTCLDIILSCLPFMLVVLLACSLQTAYEDRARASRTHNLTELLNIGYFREVLIKEIERCRRFKHPFSIAYVAGNIYRQSRENSGGYFEDGILRLAAECMRSTLRNTDFVAHVASDEFVILLTETNGAAAGIAMDKLKSRLDEIITRHYPEIKFSIGIASFEKCPYSFMEVIDMAEMASRQSVVQQGSK
ncbi:MAG TPA: GGDEF domain-containing protein [Dissulfurispiraceae bacterium]|nr:GGDEF domain-containing protein [Dissulfurispiraceae bacterium]